MSKWSVGFSMVSLLAGIVAAQSVRFPLIIGGLVSGGLVLMFPVGVL
jgi:hypothetical protein